MANKKYSQWKALSCALARNRYANSYKLATLLLETFLENDGQITAQKAYDLGLCSKDEGFRDWRKKLCELSWLEFIIENNKSVTYKPGKKLLKYINREKQNRFELATKEDLKLALAQKADRSEVEELRTTVDRILNIIDPPADKEKEKKLAQGGYDDRFLTLVRQKEAEL